MRWCLFLLLLPALALAQPLEKSWRHAEEFSRSGPDAVDYVLGLGAFQKIGGRWRLKHSENISAELERITWQVQEGFTAEEGFDWYREQLPADAELLFECQGRACGSSAQWASRIFEERVLYGHDDRQRYAVWRVQEGERRWTLVLYSVDRANRRHFIRLDRLAH